MLGLLAGLTLLATTTSAEPPSAPVEPLPIVEPIVIVEELSLQDFARAKADQYGASYDEIETTVDGESGWATHLCGDNGASCNVAQFQVGTFNWFRKTAIEQGHDFGALEYGDPYSQLELMAWAFSQGEEYKEHWTCYRARVSHTLPADRC